METEENESQPTTNCEELDSGLVWKDLGVDWSPYRQDLLSDRVKECGELTVLYAVMASLGARPITKEDSKQIRGHKWMHVTRMIEKPYGSASARRLLTNLEQRRPDRFPVPWLGRYYKEHVPTDDKVNLLEQFAAGVFRRDQSFLERLFATAGTTCLNLCDDGLIIPSLEIHADFHPVIIVLWLDFLVNGHSDPTLRPAFERYRPDRLNDYAAFVSAYEQLLRAEGTKSISH